MPELNIEWTRCSKDDAVFAKGENRVSKSDIMWSMKGMATLILYHSSTELVAILGLFPCYSLVLGLQG